MWSCKMLCFLDRDYDNKYIARCEYLYIKLSREMII